jgi:hypothetical protein
MIALVTRTEGISPRMDVAVVLEPASAMLAMLVFVQKLAEFSREVSSQVSEVVGV